MGGLTALLRADHATASGAVPHPRSGVGADARLVALQVRAVRGTMIADEHQPLCLLRDLALDEVKLRTGGDVKPVALSTISNSPSVAARTHSADHLPTRAFLGAT